MPRGTVTDWLELVGLLLVVAAIAAQVAVFSVPASLAVAGVLLIVVSAVVAWRAPHKAVPRAEDEVG